MRPAAGARREAAALGAGPLCGTSVRAGGGIRLELAGLAGFVVGLDGGGIGGIFEGLRTADGVGGASTTVELSSSTDNPPSLSEKVGIACVTSEGRAFGV